MKTNLVIVILFMALCGCNDASSSQDNKPNKAKSDMQTTGADLVIFDMDIDLCSPILACPDDICGALDDGCGGELDCGACECTDGQPNQVKCGLCGLGQKVCNGEQASCIAPPIPGLDEMTCSNDLLYVDISLEQGGIGTRELPFALLTDALAKAREMPVKAILVKGNGSQAQVIGRSVELINGVSIVGGFTSDWVYNSDDKPAFKIGAELSNDDFIGLVALNIDKPTLVHNVKLSTPNNPNSGASNYGLYVKDSNALELVGVEVVAGEAGDGIDGKDGATGAFGANGADALPPMSTTGGSLAGGETFPNFQSCLFHPQYYCVGAAGGQGRYWQPISQAIIAETAGLTSFSMGIGGEPGRFRFEDGRPGQQGEYETMLAVDGLGGVAQGTVVDGYWLRANDGKDGEQGPMGGGGGGGGGAFSSGISVAPHCGNCQGCQICPAPAGGGGGGGGEGGFGGKAGSGGGSSFGLFLVNSNVKAANCIFRASFAGTGGLGGRGGRGGLGGRGGRGGRDITVNGQSYPTIYRGGDGAPGLNGLTGGNGGGGAGGDSVGAYCSGSSIQRDALTRYEHSGSASGGRSDGVPGEDGRGVEQVGCE